MLLFELALFIAIVTLIVFLSTRIMWLFFLLFGYRFFETIFTYQEVASILPVQTQGEYKIVLLFMAIMLYVIVMAATVKVKYLQHILLVALAVWVIRTYSFSEVLFFRDYFESKGMWNLHYWKTQIVELFTLSPEQGRGIFDRVLGMVGNFISNIVEFVKKI